MEDRRCKTCKWHTMQVSGNPSISATTTCGVSVDWFCNNRESKYFEEFTLYSNMCEKWQGDS